MAIGLSEFARTRHLIIIYPVGLVVSSTTNVEYIFCY